MEEAVPKEGSGIILSGSNAGSEFGGWAGGHGGQDGKRRKSSWPREEQFHFLTYASMAQHRGSGELADLGQQKSLAGVCVSSDALWSLAEDTGDSEQLQIVQLGPEAPVSSLVALHHHQHDAIPLFMAQS